VCAQLHFNICKETGVKLDNKHWYDHVPKSVETSGVPEWGSWGVQTPSPRNSEGPPKLCQTQPDCENS